MRRLVYLSLLLPMLLGTDYVHMDDTTQSWLATMVDCDNSTGKLDFNSTTKMFECQTDGGGMGGGLSHDQVMARASYAF